MTAHKITCSSELMDNYLHAEVMAPESSMCAIPSADDHAMLFSISTGGDLYVTVEETGSKSGWERYNMTGVLAAERGGARCVHFAACKNDEGQIDVAAVMRIGTEDFTEDFLYLSLGNPSDDLAWLASAKWQFIKYDDVNHPRRLVQISAVSMHEASDSECIVVDVLRDATQSVANTAHRPIFRYYIDPRARKGPAWNAHDVAVDLESGQYSSVLGRKGNQGRFKVDGVYTNGQIGGEAQLVYQPLYNIADKKLRPVVSRLHLPGDGIADAIASLPGDDRTTGLFAMSGGVLYLFESKNQDDGARATRLLGHELFRDTRDLFAARTETGGVIVWGRNRANVIFYTTVRAGHIADPDQWSMPVPLLSNAEAVSPYYGKNRSTNCFFAHTGEDRLVKAYKCPDTGLWSKNEISLPSPDGSRPARKFSSYTTRVEIRDAADLPLSHGEVQLSAARYTKVYVNHIYYVLGPLPITVRTDAVGELTITEAVTSLSGSQLTITSNRTTVSIDPSADVVDRAMALDTPEALRSAQVKSLDGKNRPLIPKGVSEDALKSAARANARMAEIKKDSIQPSANKRARTASVIAKSHHPDNIPAAGLALDMASAANRQVSVESFVLDVGDFFVWLGHEIETGVECVVDFVKRAGETAWSIVVEIAGATYRAVLDTVEAIAEAATWLYNVVKTAVEDLIDFLSFLFNPEDLVRTKTMIKRMVQFGLVKQVAELQDLKQSFDSSIDDLEQKISEWAGLKDHAAAGVAKQMSGSMGSHANSGPPRSPATDLMGHHFKENASKVTEKGAKPEPNLPQGVMGALLTAAEAEFDAAKRMVEDFGDLIANAGTKTFPEIIKAMVGIIANFGLSSVKTLGDAVFDVLKAVLETAIRGLDTPIHIPVLSDILNAFGVEDFSLLDIICWVAAVPATLLYKAITGHAPFPGPAPRGAAISPAIGGAAISPAIGGAVAGAAIGGAAVAATMPMPGGVTPLLVSPENFEVAMQTLENWFAHGLQDAKAMYAEVSQAILAFLQENGKVLLAIGNFCAGICALVMTVTGPLEASFLAKGNPLSTPNAVLGIVGGITNAIGMQLGERYPLNDPTAAKFSTISSMIRIGMIITLSSTARGKVQGGADDSNTLKEWRAVGSAVDAVMIIPAISCTIYHLVELGHQPESYERSVSIINESANIAGYIGRVAYAAETAIPAVTGEGAIVFGVCNLVSCGLLIAEASVQTHNIT